MSNRVSNRKYGIYSSEKSPRVNQFIYKPVFVVSRSLVSACTPSPGQLHRNRLTIMDAWCNVNHIRKHLLHWFQRASHIVMERPVAVFQSQYRFWHIEAPVFDVECGLLFIFHLHVLTIVDFIERLSARFRCLSIVRCFVLLWQRHLA